MIIHQIEGYIQNSYVVQEDKKLFLLDGCSKSDYKTIYLFITEKLNLTISDLKLSIITHAHPDHVGAAIAFYQNHQVPIAANPLVTEWYSGIGGTIQQFVDISLAHFVALRKKNKIQSLWLSKNIALSFFLKGGDELPFFMQWRVLETPGHTSADICLYREKCGTLYVGDTILVLNNKLVLPFPVLFRDKMEQSLLYLASLPVKRILPAHGNTLESKVISKMITELAKKVYLPYNKKFNVLKYFVHFNKKSQNWLPS